MTSFNPANGQLIWEGHAASKEVIEKAHHAAKQSLGKWSSMDLNSRAEIVKNFAKKVEEKKDELANLISLETGKPLWESKTEVSAVIGKVNLSIQAYHDRTEAGNNLRPSFQTPWRGSGFRGI